MPIDTKDFSGMPDSPLNQLNDFVIQVSLLKEKLNLFHDDVIKLVKF
jgi:hypothetical protein